MTRGYDVFTGTPGARAATLTFMAGGSESAIGRAEEFLLQMGRRVIRVGPVGSGCIAKLCNNLMAAVNLVGTSEVVGLGTRSAEHSSLPDRSSFQTAPSRGRWFNTALRHTIYTGQGLGVKN